MIVAILILHSVYRVPGLQVNIYMSPSELHNHPVKWTLLLSSLTRKDREIKKKKKTYLVLS